MGIRPYQQETADALFNFLEICEEGEHAIAALPTGSGKTYVLCEIIDQILSEYPEEEILILSHVKEILEQDYLAISDFFEGVDIGLYSAGLDSREKRRITVAGIQSVHTKTELFKKTGIVIIDECHLIPPSEQSRYRKFLNSLPDAIYLGLTATPFRLGQGYLHTGEDALFTEIVSDYTTYDKFNSLIDDGYLSNLYVKKTVFELDTKGIGKLGGDFSEKDLSKKLDRKWITKKAIEETIKFGKNYKKWLIFAIDINHAENIAAELNKQGIPTVCIHSQMKFDRHQALNDYRVGKYRCAVNIDIMTTGLDIPAIDMIISLRPSMSPVFHSQSIGRGLRVTYKEGMPIDTAEERLAAIAASGKKHCFILDFAGNTKRLGPVNDITINEKKKGKGNGLPIVKVCPNCQLYCASVAKFCPACNWKFEFKEKISAIAESQLDILRRQQKELKDSVEESLKKADAKQWVKIKDVVYSIHEKTGRPSSLKVTYNTGLQTFSEWVTIDHNGYNRSRALNWVKHRLPENLYHKKMTLNELLGLTQRLKVPYEVMIDTTSKYPQIKDAKLPDEFPEEQTGPGSKSHAAEISSKPSAVVDFDDDIPF